MPILLALLIPGSDVGKPQIGMEINKARAPLTRKPTHQAPTHRGLVDCRGMLNKSERHKSIQSKHWETICRKNEKMKKTGYKTTSTLDTLKHI